MIKTLIFRILKHNIRKKIQRWNPTIIAVCGSVGKTTVRNLLVQSLEKYGVIGTNRGNYNTEWGTLFSFLGVSSPGKNPLAWAKLIFKSFEGAKTKEEFPDIWVLELGIDKPGDMDFFTQDFLTFDCVIFTYYGQSPVHMENFESVKDLVQEDIHALTALKKDGYIIANADDTAQSSMIKKHKGHVITYGTHEADVQMMDLNCEIQVANSPQTWQIYGSALKPILHQKISYRGSFVPFTVEYMFGNAQAKCLLPVVSFFIHEGVHLIEISQNIQTYLPVNGRMRFLEGIKNTIVIDDSYNASPASVKEGIESLQHLKITKARKIAVLGSMMELGESEVEEHRKIGQLASKHVQILITVGDKMIHAHQEFKNQKNGNISVHVQDTTEAIDWIKLNITPKDVFYVKGSASTHMERVVEGIISHPEYTSKNLVRQPIKNF